MMNDYLNLNSFLNDISNQTPNRNNPSSRYHPESPFNNSGQSSFFNPYLSKSNGVAEIRDLTDINDLTTKFINEENSIKFYCRYYISLKSIFDEVDIKVKNLLLTYVSQFNSSCKSFNEKKTTEMEAHKKYSDAKNRLKEDLNQQKEDMEKIINAHRAQIEEIKIKNQKEIEEYKTKLNRAEAQIHNMKKENENLKQIIKQKEKDIVLLREELADPEETISPDYVTISYYLGQQSEDLKIDLDCPSKRELDKSSSKFEKAEKNFNIYANMLAETTNKTIDQYKELYLKVKGKEYNEPNNILKKVHNLPAFNLNQDLCWTNINNIHLALNYIINEIFELVNPTREVDAQRLNEDSCRFLLNYIIGLKKLFFMQKQILETSFKVGKSFEEKSQNFEEFKKLTQETEQFFDENDDILKNQTFYERFKEELKEENTETMTVDEYLKKMKTVLVQAKKISENQENELNEYLKKMEEQSKRRTIEELELMSNSKNKGFENNINDI